MLLFLYQFHEHWLNVHSDVFMMMLYIADILLT